MTKLRITQVRSAIKSLPKQKATLKALGIKRLNHTVELTQTPQVEGMIRIVSHLVKVEKA
ncbi:MAG TPA: 50S ribosomal protein L30 [Chitinophagales bacterium]|nr:50S ribosomal protein L30 [Chitinophagales bacterium]